MPEIPFCSAIIARGAGVDAEPGQLELRATDLESLLPEGHRVRTVWAYVERADLSSIYSGIKALEGGSGRTPIAPEILFALW
ncbi:MAG: transposase, partial [Proteobacteria bacterium]|nr:transposase [Pseudomonadota bacterium]